MSVEKPIFFCDTNCPCSYRPEVRGCVHGAAGSSRQLSSERVALAMCRSAALPAMRHSWISADSPYPDDMFRIRYFQKSGTNRAFTWSSLYHYGVMDFEEVLGRMFGHQDYQHMFVQQEGSFSRCSYRKVAAGALTRYSATGWHSMFSSRSTKLSQTTKMCRIRLIFALPCIGVDFHNAVTIALGRTYLCLKLL